MGYYSEEVGSRMIDLAILLGIIFFIGAAIGSFATWLYQNINTLN